MVILIIRIYPWDQTRFSVSIRMRESDSDAEVGEELLPRPLNAFDPFRTMPVDNPADRVAYGKQLYQTMFLDSEESHKAERLLTEARAKAREGDQALRIQMEISSSLTSLHDLYWETLHDPVTDQAISLFDRYSFSRYIASPDCRRVLMRTRNDLEALVVIANPFDIAQKKLSPIDVEDQKQRAREALGDIPTTFLDTTAKRPVTLETILETFRGDKEGFDILYLVCHGFFSRKDQEKDQLPWLQEEQGQGKQPRLWLQDEEGQAKAVSGIELATQLAELAYPPRLIVLVSCQSAGTGNDAIPLSVTSQEGEEKELTDRGALTALGPQLARRGIPAVLAMRGNISVNTMNAFLPAFFQSLKRENGQIDLAVARARSVVRGRPDAWRPVLFMRLNTGRLWAEVRQDDVDWDALAGFIQRKQCTPILGPGLTDHLFGPQRNIAHNLADTFRYPLAPQHSENLPRVAQFLTVTRKPVFASQAYIDQLRRELQRRHDECLTLAGHLEFPDLIAKVGESLRKENEAEPHRVFAQLGCPLYVTTNPDSLLYDALREEGKEKGFQPVDLEFPWRRIPRCRPWAGQEVEHEEENSSDQPVVYHLFGRFLFNERTRKPDYRSLVLSQDDYFEWLLTQGKNADLIPSKIKDALTDSCLLILGFELTDWSIRILLEMIRSFGSGGGFLKDYTHVAIQLDPAVERVQDPEMARNYLRRLAGLTDMDVRIFWGSVQDFASELHNRLAVSSFQTPVLTNGEKGKGEGRQLVGITT